jgi:hypothetical protein
MLDGIDRRQIDALEQKLSRQQRPIQRPSIEDRPFLGLAHASGGVHDPTQSRADLDRVPNAGSSPSRPDARGPIRAAHQPRIGPAPVLRSCA